MIKEIATLIFIGLLSTSGYSQVIRYNCPIELTGPGLVTFDIGGQQVSVFGGAATYRLQTTPDLFKFSVRVSTDSVVTVLDRRTGLLTEYLESTKKVLVTLTCRRINS